MSSPIPPDPYEALGVSKDADLTAIRSSHRKLALKHHPDRIKDEADRLKGKDEFQKVQQAYEILSDPEKRSRYDDKVKLAELRREAMMREPPSRPQAYSMRPGPSPTMRREYHDGAYFEERVPSGSYFDINERFDEPTSRASARKYNDYDRRNAPRPSTADRKPSNSSKWDAPVAGMSFNMASHLKNKATEAKERVRDKNVERESQSARTKTRDKDERRERSEKEDRRTFVVDADSSDSEDYNQRPSRSSKPSPGSSRKSEPKRKGPERSRSHRDEEEEKYSDAWEHRHKEAFEYIVSSRDRPSVQRSESDAPRYWDVDESGHGRRSGSDSDRQPKSSKQRGPSIDVPKQRTRPSMQTQSSAPPFVVEREPVSARSSGRNSNTRERDREPRREIPTMNRSQTMPTSVSRKDNAPSKSSNLRHAETHDSGYGSSSPHTPEMPEHSPPREQVRQPSTKTKYQIVEPAVDEEDTRGHRTVLIDEEDRRRRFVSPPNDRDRRDRAERAERPKMSAETRTRSSRPSSTQSPSDLRPPALRSETSRHIPSSPRESPPVSRNNSGRATKLFGEVDEREQSPYSHRHPGDSASTSPKMDSEKMNHGSYRRRDTQEDHDYFPGSKYRDDLRQPMSGRRASAH